MATLTNLLDFDPAQLVAYCAELGEKPFRAKQLQRWIHQFGVAEFRRHDRPGQVAARKAEDPRRQSARRPSSATTRRATAPANGWSTSATATRSKPCSSRKKTRGTLCICTQAGCAVNCRFCSTGKQGFNRNLTVAEIIGQLWMAEFELRRTKGIEAGPKGERQITNVVMMGMGEPLLNFEPTVTALKLMLDDNAYGLSRRRVTVSTSGVVPNMDKLSQECPVALAVSLHGSNDPLRDMLVPLNKKYPLRELMAACKRYLEFAPRDFITFEYCMLDGVNDTDEHARELIALVNDPVVGVSCKFNLIPFNPVPGIGPACARRTRASRPSPRC